MRLARSRSAGTIVPVAAIGDHWFDLSPLVAEIGPEALSAASLDRIRTAIGAGQLREAETPTRYAPPLTRIGKIVCIGLNYSDHAAETAPRVRVGHPFGDGFIYFGSGQGGCRAHR